MPLADFGYAAEYSYPSISSLLTDALSNTCTLTELVIQQKKHIAKEAEDDPHSLPSVIDKS